SLIIDRTEAMTVVDVNTGKFTGSGGNLEETVTKNNLEAAEEIVRQLRLRDIGGIIVIDFIDMVLELNRDLVLRRLVESLGRDRTKHQVAEVTSLGLVQMTRKRIGTGLLEAFSENCDHCGGRGLIVHDEPRDAKRRSDGESGRGRGANGGGENKSSGEGNGGGDGGGSGSGGGEGGGKATKSSRSGRGRGKGRGRGDSVEDQQPEPSNDAAQRLAEIAAASTGAGQHHHDQHHHDQHDTDQHDRDQHEADQHETDRSGPDQSGSDQNGAEKNGTGRRRRNSRSNGSNRRADSDEGDSRADAPELAVTPV
ncbi:MAG: ribonuclease, partial [Kribbellaceae bacterium]|nr:ribonuclease [Kribbellaceae bacterium]